jgi:hypothetical protein
MERLLCVYILSLYYIFFVIRQEYIVKKIACCLVKLTHNHLMGFRATNKIELVCIAINLKPWRERDLLSLLINEWMLIRPHLIGSNAGRQDLGSCWLRRRSVFRYRKSHGVWRKQWLLLGSQCWPLSMGSVSNSCHYTWERWSQGCTMDKGKKKKRSLLSSMDLGSPTSSDTYLDSASLQLRIHSIFKRESWLS